MVSGADGNFTHISPKILLEPVFGLGTAYQFIQSASLTDEKRRRVATLASFLLTSVTAVNSDPSTNAAVGAAVGCQLNHMKKILNNTRGGASQFTMNFSFKHSTSIIDSIKTPTIHPYRAQFSSNCNIAINNMFQQHTTCRYIQGCNQKFRAIAPAYMAPLSSSAKISAIKLNSWAFFGFGIIAFSILESLYLFKRVKYKSKCECQHNVTSEPFFFIDV